MMKMAKAKVFNMQSFSTSDGPGIRTVVFFQGCNLRCDWCHNPESQAVDEIPEIFIAEKCIACEVCEGECYAGARSKTVREFTVDELWNLLATDLPYIKNSTGGITFSGGECMLQVEFLEEIVKICRKNGVHTAVDTAGHVPFEWLQRVNPDMFLYDIKASNPQKHLDLTGVDGVLIWENLRKLTQKNYDIQLRIPCIPEANWDEMQDIANRLKEIGVKNIELLAYHRLGEGKATWLGKEAKIFNTPSEEEMNLLWKLFGYQKK